MSANKRTIEVFTAGCPVCRETIDLVRQMAASCGCEVVERRCEGETCCAPAISYGVKALPTIVVDGKIAFEGRPTLEQARDLLAV
ncbi:MAG: thioredoxin family protein [Pyrinomonadaceae bacterium MAG19_C2-C3]|nr:thioredoxin family protein [Pyrinomonadaceae bacterium MAG19_C2-C3]